MRRRLAAEFISETIGTRGGAAGEDRKPGWTDGSEVNHQERKAGGDLEQCRLVPCRGCRLEAVVDVIDLLPESLEHRHHEAARELRLDHLSKAPRQPQGVDGYRLAIGEQHTFDAKHHGTEAVEMLNRCFIGSIDKTKIQLLNRRLETGLADLVVDRLDAVGSQHADNPTPRRDEQSQAAPANHHPLKSQIADGASDRDRADAEFLGQLVDPGNSRSMLIRTVRNALPQGLR